jgi:orotate phosphoribosyltransferase
VVWSLVGQVASPGRRSSSAVSRVRLSDDDAYALFESCGALKTGHFVLTSGRHSDKYFEKFDVLRWPSHVTALGEELAARATAAGIVADVVLGPTTLGIVLAYEVGRHLGLPAAYGEKGPDGKRMVRRPDHLTSEMRVLIVDDVLTTGGSIRECQELVATVGATCVGVGVLVDRAGGTIDFGAPLVSTLTLNAQSWAPDEVPAWLEAIEITRPGSTGKK